MGLNYKYGMTPNGMMFVLSFANLSLNIYKICIRKWTDAVQFIQISQPQCKIIRFVAVIGNESISVPVTRAMSTIFCSLKGFKLLSSAERSETV
jgi:hypothetical protein